MNKYKLSREREKELHQFCKKVNLNFNSYELLDLAFHHRSYSNENLMYKHINNERLEFLGDSVLGLVAATYLYQDMENSQEGELAKIKANVVSEAVLSVIALEKLEINKYLILGKGEEHSGGRTKKAILADAFEAIIGAIYIDSGFKNAQKFVLRYLIPEIKKVQIHKGNKDYKSILQEYYQKRTKESPVYKVEYTEGPEHDKRFYVSVKLGKTIYGPSAGKSKKDAEQNVAKATCEFLGIDEKD